MSEDIKNSEEDEQKKEEEEEEEELTTRQQIYALFEDPHSSSAALYISHFINMVILVSTIAFLLETVPYFATEDYETTWSTIETVCVILFSLDFAIRCSTCPSQAEFWSDFMNWIDIIAILPFYIELFFYLFFPDMSAEFLSSFRIFRVLRLARVLKILNKSDGAHDEDNDVGKVISDIVSTSAGALAIPMYFMMLALIVFSSLIYYVERPEYHDCAWYPDLDCNGNECTDAVCNGCSLYVGRKSKLTECPCNGYGDFFQYEGECIELPDGTPTDSKGDILFISIPDSFWWCIVTMTTVGYGDKYPITGLGQLVAVLTMTMGIFFISMPLAIVGSSFANACEEILESKKQSEAIKASYKLGYTSTSFKKASHAVLVMDWSDIGEHLKQMDKVINDPNGKREDVVELVQSLRDRQTAFSSLLHKQLFLLTLKEEELEDGEDDESSEI